MVLRELRSLRLHSHLVILHLFQFASITYERLLQRDHLFCWSIQHKELPKTWPDLLLPERNQVEF